MVVLMVGEADRIEDQMIMNMSLINMGGKYKLVLATQYFFCQLQPNLMGFCGGDLSRLKGLDQVAAQVRALVDGMAARPFKFNVGGLSSAAEGGYKQLPVRLVGIADIPQISPKQSSLPTAMAWCILIVRAEPEQKVYLQGLRKIFFQLGAFAHPVVFIGIDRISIAYLCIIYLSLITS